MSLKFFVLTKNFITFITNKISLILFGHYKDNKQLNMNNDEVIMHLKIFVNFQILFESL